MSNDDHQLTPEERAEISRRKVEVEVQKKIKKEETLGDLKKELGIPEKDNRA